MRAELPVILFRGLVLLPYGEIRIEVDRDFDKAAILDGEIYHDDHVLVVPQQDMVEQKPLMNDLPKMGCIGKVTMKMELPNGLLRIVIKGVSRANVFSYSNQNGYYKALIGPINIVKMDSKEEMFLVNKLKLELEQFVTRIPYVSNSIIAEIAGIINAPKISDVVGFFIPTNFARKMQYLETIDPLHRIKMLLEDIHAEYAILELEQDIDLQLKKSLDTTQREFILREKMRIIKDELKEGGTKESEIDKIKERISKLKAPKVIIEKLHSELKKYESTPIASPELGIINNYINWLLDLPWKIYTKDNENLIEVKKILDANHSNLEKPKERIIEYLAVKKMSKGLNTPIICLVGPPGTGKTTFAKSIAKAMKRNFVKISVGGTNDEAEIVGHRKTYIGAAPGKIIAQMKRAGSANPLFLIDEIDKMTKDIKGDPASCLLEVLDKEQNAFFMDHYVDEEFNLSQVMFICTSNYLDQIPEALRDRLEIIEMSGYTELEKQKIANEHLIDNSLIKHGLKAQQIKFSTNIISDIIRYYTKEAGVRELERNIDTVIRKIVTKMALEKVKKEQKININKNDLKEYLGLEKYSFNKNKENLIPGVVNGLAYTIYGGDILPIEATLYSGKGNIHLTGQLGNVMKESADIALSYIKSNCKEYNIDFKLLEKNDIHLHIPEGAVRKEGPSAGVTLVTVLLSLLKQKVIDSSIAMTGEITLRGEILPIGGLKEKLIGASKANIKKVFIPKENKSDLEEIELEIKKGIDIILVSNYKDIYKKLF